MSKRSKKIVNGQAREIIYNVVNYMQKEKEIGVHNINQVQRRAAEATGMSIRMVQHIMAEVKTSGPVFRTPGQHRAGKRRITDMNNIDKAAIKRCIHDLHVAEKNPTLGKILEKLKTDFAFEGSMSSLNRILKQLGYEWKKDETNRRILTEKSVDECKPNKCTTDLVTDKITINTHNVCSIKSKSDTKSDINRMDNHTMDFTVDQIARTDNYSSECETKSEYDQKYSTFIYKPSLNIKDEQNPLENPVKVISEK